MSDLIKTSSVDGVAFLAMAHAPSNLLDAGLRRALFEAVSAAEADPETRVIVLIGDGPIFSSGTAILERRTDGADAPTLGALCTRIEDCAKPVVAAMEGQALGGGLELAVAAHYRIARPGLRLAMPDWRTGRLPAAGGTQRLPRLLPVGTALDLLVGGQTLIAGDASTEPLFEIVEDVDLVEMALGFAEGLIEAGLGPQRTADRMPGAGDPAGYYPACRARAEEAEKRSALMMPRILSLVEAAPLLPFEAGLAMEEDAAAEVAADPRVQGLEHLGRVEVRAQSFPRPVLPDAPPVETVAILGGGTIAAHLVVACLNAGFRTHWGTLDPEVLKTNLPIVENVLRHRVALGLAEEADVGESLDRLALGDAAEMAADAQLRLHAGPGLSGVPGPAAVPCLKIFPAPVRYVALRFLPPAYSSPVVEVLEGPEARVEDLAAAWRFVRALSKRAVHSRSRGVSLAGRLYAAQQRAADILLDLGQSPYAVDDAVRTSQVMHPPFELRDVRGLRDLAEAPRAEGARNWASVFVAEGRTGRATNAGVYRYDEGTRARDPEALALIDTLGQGHAPMPPETIRGFLHAAVVNECARTLAERQVDRCDGLDLMSVVVLGTQRTRGGVLHAADQAGLLPLRRHLEEIGHPDRAFLDPHPLWTELIANGRGFTDLDRT